MASQSPHINRWRAFALLAVAFFMTVIDLTIVNVSLPTIGRDLHFSENNLQWVVTAYARSRSAGSCCSAAGPPICSAAAAC
jgi:MFS family permease